MCSPTLLLLSCQQTGYCPRDSESLALLIEWVLVWNTHTHAHTRKHTSIHVHTHWWLCCKWREGEGWVSGLAWWANINHCLSASPFFFFFLSAPTPRLSTSSHFSSASLISLCFEWWCVCVCVCVCVRRMQSDHMDKTPFCFAGVTVLSPPIKSCVVCSRTSGSWQTRCILIRFTCERH